MDKQQEESNHGEWLHFSLKGIVLIVVGIALFIWYVSALLFGENSLSVYNRLDRENFALKTQSENLRISNQKLQKEYFELIQLNGD